MRNWNDEPTMQRARSWSVMAAAASFVAALAWPETVVAHVTGADVAGGFSAGFAHPYGGADHIAAMVAVGLWGAFLGQPAIWILPVVFPLVMAFGGVLGAAGVPLPGVEIGIAASAVVLGLMVALAVRPPIWIAAVIVGAFAIFHGYAHGAELPAGVSRLTYSAGFVVATGLLHLAGIALSLLTRWPLGSWLVRGGGVAISALGIVFLWR